MPENKTAHYGLAMPHPDNLLEDDVNLLRSTIMDLDSQLFVAAEARQGLQAMLDALQDSLTGQGTDFSAQLVALGNTLGQHSALAATAAAKGHTMPGTGLSVDANGKISVQYGSTAGTACAGDDARLTQAASTAAPGHVKLNDTVTSTSTTEAATANAVKQAYDKAASITIPLNNTVTSTSTTEAATANAVKQAYDKGNSAYSTASSAQSTANSAYNMASYAAPKPSNYSGVGQVTKVSVVGGNLTVPSGGSWFVVYFSSSSPNGTWFPSNANQAGGGVYSGGSSISIINYNAVAVCWRVA